MQIVVWQNFSKRRNSTRRPGSSSGTTVNVALKENTSVEHPTFILSGNDFTINYVQAFGNYYFVDDVVSVANGRIEVVCTIDSLATHKGTIGAYYAFVERSFSDIDPDIPDPYVSMMNHEIISGYTYGSSSYIFSSTGYYAVSVLNDRGSGNGFTTTYFMTAGEVLQLAQYVNNDWGSGATTLLDWVQSSFLKTADSIIDCVWLPISISAIGSGSTSYEEVKVGVDIVTGVYGYRVLGNIVATDTEVVGIPHYYSDFRKGAPYTRGKLFLPMFGCIDFNPLDFPDDNLYIRMDLDAVTGDVTVYLFNDSSYLIGTYMYNVAVTCPVGKVSQNLSGMTGSLLSTVGSTVSAFASSGTSAVASGISATSSAINTLSDAITPMTSYRGSKGGRSAAEYGLIIRVTTISKETVDPAWIIPTHGRPLMQQKQISSLSGFIKCSGASVPISGHPREKQEVDDYLNSGFYYE